MKKTILLALAIYSGGPCFALAQGGDMFSNFSYGYRASGAKHLFPAMLMISTGETAPKVLKGWVEKEKHVYYGDRMPPGNYDDQWVVVGFRDKDQKEFSAETIVWQHSELVNTTNLGK